MEKLEEFFNFLENHVIKPENNPFVRTGFEEVKKRYTLSYWEYYHSNGDFRIIKESENLYFVDIGGTVRIEDNQEFYEDEKLYLNPDKQILIKKKKIQDIEQEWRIEEYSLFNELKRLYYRKFGTFYREFLKFIDQNYPQGNYESKVKTTLVRINYFKKIANSVQFSIKQFGEDRPLLLFYLDKLTKKIINDFSPNLSLEDSSSQIDNEESINLESKNLFNVVPIKVVKEFFENFTLLNLNNDSEPVLTSKQVNVFLKRAFIEFGVSKNNREKIKMNFTHNTINRKIIVYIFYKFFKKSEEQFGEKRYGNKEKYVKLLTDNFEGFEEKLVFNNFEKEPSIFRNLVDIISEFK